MAGDTTLEEMTSSSDVKKLIQRHVNCLSDTSKITRKRGLLELEKETIKKKLGSTVLQEIAADVVKPVLKCFSDTSEINRELASKFVIEYFTLLPNPEITLPYIMPCLVQRLGQEDIVEPSEELRQFLVENLLALTIELCGKKVAAFLDEMILILKMTISDPFGEVKKSSCKVASSLARCVPEYFHMQSESLIVPLMHSITHQHSKVRVAVIEATADVIQFGNGKNVDDVVSHLAQRFFDQSSQVRRCVTRVIGRWLLELPDRYSFFHKFIPLILTSLNDEMPEIREEADALWQKAGKQYQEENEKDLKDKMDFEGDVPSLYPAGETRSCLGCRELVQRNLSKLMPAIIRDLGDWVPETRIKTAQLLYVLLLHAEEYTTQHMQPLMQALVRACTDDEREVFKNANKSARLIGAFVEPEVFCKLILQAVRGQAGVNPSGLEILSSTLSGCTEEVLGGHIDEIARTLTDPDVCQASEKADYHIGLLHCVDSLIQTCDRHIEKIGLSLFTVVITVISLSKDESVQLASEQSLLALANALKLEGDTSNLFVLYTKEVLDTMQATYETWTKYTIEQSVFDTLISRAGPVVVELLDEVMDILKANLKPDKDAELRLKFFTLLSKLLLNTVQSDDSESKFKTEHTICIVREMIAPNLVWQAGRVAAAVRTIAVSSLWAVLKSEVLDPDVASSLLLDPLLPLLSSTLDDDAKSTREISAKVLMRFFSTCGRRLDPDNVLHKIYMDLLKRLDDSSDEIRLTVAKAWEVYFQCFREDYSVSLYKAHLEEMYSGLLVHMDDPETNIQLAILDVLKRGGKIYPDLLRKEIDKVKHKHRTTHYCDELVKFLNSEIQQNS